MPNPASPPASPRGLSWFLATLACLLVVLGFLFAGSLNPEKILFSSDGPLGGTSSHAMAMPEAFRCIWRDLNWVGGYGGSLPPSVSNLVFWMLGPLGFAKFYAPVSVLFLALAACLLFRRLGFHPWVGLVGGVAAGLNTDFFSYACWGLGTLTLCVAAVFVALAALAGPGRASPWLKACVAGFAVGLAVTEGVDSGAILSLYVAAFVLFQAFQEPGLSPWRAGLAGLARLGIVATGAFLVAVVTLSMLVSTSISGVVGMEQDTRTKTQRWEDATQWSLPKIETLRVVIPGLFGYRMDTPEGGNYWGRVGERPGVMQRHSGAGFYVGVAVAVLALWGLANTRRGPAGPFTKTECRMIWFWTGAAFVSLLFAWGKYAPFYHIPYALPYFSTIRNPIKFMHPFSLSVVILAAYGLESIARTYLGRASVKARPWASLKLWWTQANPFERKWCFGSVLAVGGGLLGWLLYSASRTDLENHLRTAVSPELAPAIAGFSLGEVGWFVLLLALTFAVMAVIMSGVLGGSRAWWGVAALGLIVAVDLVRANTPWVYYWNYREKYASNPIIDFLRGEIPGQRVAMPYEQRVAMPPFQLGEAYALLQQLYHAEWMQHQFQFYNVQSLDVIQEPRTTVDNALYRGTFAAQREAGLLRQWQLTNTRYVFGVTGGMVELLNERLDPTQQRFRLHTAFRLAQDRAGGPILVQTNTTGPFALIEFTGALPRGKLYTRWQVSTNDQETLQILANPSFDPADSVVLDSLPANLPPATATNETTGSVDVSRYAPRHIELKSRAASPSILLWNDKFDSRWSVTVDGQPQPLLRCNFLMRGVPVPAGEHTVIFHFDSPPRFWGTSLTAIAVGLALCAWLFGRRPDPALHAANSARGLDPA